MLNPQKMYRKAWFQIYDNITHTTFNKLFQLFRFDLENNRGRPLIKGGTNILKTSTALFGKFRPMLVFSPTGIPLWTLLNKLNGLNQCFPTLIIMTQCPPCFLRYPAQLIIHFHKLLKTAGVVKAWCLGAVKKENMADIVAWEPGSGRFDGD